MKLHLGCGERYLEGYINIDYPLSNHSVQKTSVADQLIDLFELKYPAGSIDEIRLHHVFEHFSRAHSLAFLATWNRWLIIDGTLRIEVPDFYRTAKKATSMFASKKATYAGLRHLFGSQEAHWALHYVGYSKDILQDALTAFGFKSEKVTYSKWKNTYNVEIIAKKEKTLSIEEMYSSAHKILSLYTIDQTEGEMIMLEKWKDDFKVQLHNSISTSS